MVETPNGEGSILLISSGGTFHLLVDEK